MSGAMSYDLLYSNDTLVKGSLHKTSRHISFLSLSYSILPWRYTDKMQQVQRILQSEETPAALPVKESRDLC